MKQRTKRSFYLPRAMAALGISAVISAVVGIYVIEDFINDRKQSLQENVAYWCDVYPEENSLVVRSVLQGYGNYPLCVNTGTGAYYCDNAIRLTNRKTGEQYTNQFAVFLLFRSSTEQGAAYIEQYGSKIQQVDINAAMWEDIANVFTQKEIMLSSWYFWLFNESMSGSWLELETVYEKDGVFYPGKVTYGKAGTKEPFTVDYTPEWATEEMLVDEEVYFEISAGAIPASEARKQFLLSGTKDTSVLQDEWRTETYVSQSVTLSDGSSWELELYDRLPLWHPRIVEVVLGAVLFVLLSVTAALVQARFAYRKYQHQYELDEYRRNLTDTLAHDLKTPLAAISGYAENLQWNVHTEKRAYYADAIMQNVTYMNGLISDVLTLSKLDGEQVALARDTVACIQTIKTLLERYAPQLEEKELTVSVQGECVIQADERLMTQALNNLLCNAVKYTPAGGHIDIRAIAMQMVIANPCEQPHAMDGKALCKPFVKGDAARGDRTGHGLGLTIAERILRQHGYTMSVQSEEKQFTVTLQF